MRVALLLLVFISGSAFAVLDSLFSTRKCYPIIGKYEEIAMWTDAYHRWVAVTPPDYVKVFFPTSVY